jgi:fused signal recognition particle receptor
MPHDVMLVLDGSTGQMLEQAKQFTAATVSCLAVTKLDGTTKGGCDWDLRSV